MTKQKQIEEIKMLINQGFEKADCRNPYTNKPYPYFDSQINAIAESLINAGYYKSKEVRKETAKEIYALMTGEFEIYIPHEIAKEIAERYGVEVET